MTDGSETELSDFAVTPKDTEELGRIIIELRPVGDGAVEYVVNTTGLSRLGIIATLHDVLELVEEEVTDG